MSFPRETYEFLKESNIRCVRGKFDHLIAKWPDMSDEEKNELPELDRIMVEWNRSKLESDGRRWIRFEMPSFLIRKYGDNDVFFVYGDPFDPIRGEILAEMPTSYYEKFMIDTRNLDVSFHEFDFDIGEVERKIKEEKLPEEIVKILHHGI